MRQRILALALAGAAVACAPMTTGTATPQSDLGTSMRRLWTDHVVWTRGYIVAAVANDPSADAQAARLLRNQEDIGNAIAPFYGAAAAQQLTTLLKEHITIAVDLVTAAKASNTAAQNDANRRWHANAEQIATFLSSANPNWPKATLQEMLNRHLALTTQEAVARLQKDWNADTRTFDAILTQALEMADALTAGIQKQFPGRT